MSKIQEALRQLKSSAATDASSAKTRSKGFSGGASRSSVPIARKKKFRFDGDKHHVEQKQLVEAGLLAPLDIAVPIADEFRQIKRPLISNALRDGLDSGDNMNVIMIASALPRSGKTFCSVNLAVSLSLERELNVLLVDADVAKPHISREFGLSGMPGLIDVLLDDSMSIEDTLIRTDLNDVQVLPAGRGHPQATELLASERMSEVVNELAKRYPDRMIVVDSPPLLITSEARALASQVGQIALVVEAGETSHQTLVQVIDVLDKEKAINLILNKTRHSSNVGYYGGGYGYYGYEGG